MKTALVYDWFAEGSGGGEKAFEAIFDLFPSPIYTLVRDENSVRGTSFEQAKIHTSFIQNLPWGLKKYRAYLPLFPLAIEQFDLSSYDVILSCSHCVAKGVLTHADQIHLCYCYTPVRYGWDLYHQYLADANLKGLKAKFAKFFLHYLRMWDYQSNPRVDRFGAISNYVAKRIQKTYGRDATVIYPPVDLDFFQVGEKKESFYLAASRFVSYKKMDVIVEAFQKMPDKRLVVIGSGPDLDKIKAKAGKNVELLGSQPKEVLREYLQKAKAFLFAAIEDFGILPVEAQSCGTPVIAFGKGASLETVRSGTFFDEQTPAAIQRAVEKFEMEGGALDPETVRSRVLHFSKKRFNEEFRTWVATSTEFGEGL